MTEKFIYYMHQLCKQYPPNREVLKNVSLSFYYGAKIGIIGVNGSGKSTVMKIMAGLDKEFTGEAWLENGRTVGYLPQEPWLDESLDVKGNVEMAVRAKRDLLNQFNDLSMKFAEPMSDDEMNKLLEKQAKLQDAIDAANLWELDHQLEVAMDALRLPPPEADVSVLSGGEKRRVALCRLLMEEPDLLLLDEPTNHLDAESVAWLEGHLKNYKGSVILVTHDRYFLDNVVGWILELDRGRGIPWEGNYSSWLAQKTERLAKEERQESKRQTRLKRELDWVRMSPKARRAKGKARLSAYENLRDQELPEQLKQAAIVIPHGQRLGDQVIEFNDVSKAFGEKVLFENLSFNLPKSGIIGVVGPNGAGKSTLFKLITGQESSDSGSISVGATVDLSHINQERDTLDSEKSVFQEITKEKDTLKLGDVEINSRAYVGLFNFSGSDQQKLVGKLSGGERNRVHLAKLLQKGGNVLLLDEPTNDLDVETLQALEQAVLNFSGCAVIISHDRWFLNRVATHILGFEGNSKVHWHTGDYDSYEEGLKERLGVKELIPKRIQYKKFKR